ncbi:MAG: NAD(P)-dependent oxidoreductase [Alcanivoracaceae bacterium]|uniref:SDR family oxidoreductase n=1 Tax=Alcanivorax profundi TaxID=2338368 RepID=A0A418Y0C0_9GAMM|nr:MULTISPECIES: SDR family oxidoreductase [Alcanivorax]MAX55810.1 NAD(P)-dependent oxidoreductase [Alcanivoracaceae bacterium]MCG8437212.1 SDR family oxidoreductase [Pseudomonadales bacterium]MED5432608.1 SDR family oxidoreductase [Pseudomonadota bacterium]ERP90082.1 2-dehydro-3-deoxy-D-gluconate 5-dehydrogenase [Alcanivorax sp. P2S70]MEE2871212.1 SDR family oxidoreductase [Pseudomonadota bacterium]|tara:strand:- start:2745 stop:3500 length:756 start_codon:yes stop_codon:yes gene_type:complete
MTQRFSVAGKRILITGASSGFGARFAVALAEEGADVVLAARRVEKLEQTAEAVRKLGREATVVAMDVSDHASVGAAFDSMPPVDVVVNNAGISHEGPTDSLTEEEWDAVVDTNLKGVWAVSKFAIQKWKQDQRPGSLVNIASILGLRVGGRVAAYTASKAAVVQLTKSLALDFARYNIRCNAICPGYVETDINKDFFDSPQAEKMLKRIPYRRLGQIDELVGPLLLLASDASSYMTGAIIAVDGGHLCNTL